MNEALISNAVKFLSDSSVKGSTTERQVNFLKNKGLSQEELDEAFRRAGLSTQPPDSANGHPSGNQNNYSSPYYPPVGASYFSGDPQEHLYQLARTSNAAKWILLIAVVASTLAFLARSLPRDLYQRFVNWFKGADDAKLLDLSRKIDSIRTILETLQKRQNHMESELTAWRYHKNMEDINKENNSYFNRDYIKEYEDCVEDK